MASNAAIPDIVLDTRLEVEIHDEHTIYFQYDGGDETTGIRPERRPETWRLGRNIGAGGFGTVWLETCLSGSRPERKGQSRAIKRINRRGKQDRILDVNRELEAIGKFSQRGYRHCFVRSFGWYETERHLCIVMEYLEAGDLSRFLDKPFPETEAAAITKQLLEGLGFMHRHSFAHRDLKPQNILVKSTSPDWWVKISDFGISKRIQSSNVAAAASTVVGTEAYMAPEQRDIYPSGIIDLEQCKSPSTAVDIWALGLVAWQMVAGTPAFRNGGAVFSYVARGSALPRNVGSDMFYDFATRALAPEPPWIQRFSSSSNSNPAPPLPKQSESDSAATKTQADSTEYARWTTTPESPPTAAEKPVSPGEKDRSSFITTIRRTVPIQPSRDAATQDSAYAPWTTGRSHKSPVASPSVVQASTATARVVQRDRRASSDGGSEDEEYKKKSERANRYYRKHKYAEAEPLLREIVDRDKAIAGRHTTQTLLCLYHLARSVYKQRRYAESEVMFREAFENQFLLLGSFHEDTNKSLFSFARAVHEQDRAKEAEPLFLMAYDVSSTILGTHRDTANAQFWHARSIYVQDDFKRAEPLLRQAYEARKEILGAEHEDTIQALYSLARSIYEQERYAAAEDLLRAAYVQRKKALGPNHYDSTITLYWLARTLYEQGRYLDAEDSLRWAYNGETITLGIDHADTINTKYWIAKAMYMQNAYKAAEPLFNEVLQVRTRLFGPEDKDTIKAAFWLGQTLFSLGRYKEAEPNFNRTYLWRDIHLGSRDSETASARDMLEKTRRRTKWKREEIANFLNRKQST